MTLDLFQNWVVIPWNTYYYLLIFTWVNWSFAGYCYILSSFKEGSIVIGCLNLLKLIKQSWLEELGIEYGNETSDLCWALYFYLK